MKKNKILMVGLLALALIFTFSMVSCSGKSFNTAEELKAYLDKQPANSPDKPIKVTMSVNDQMLSEIAGVIRDAGKYVGLNLSGKTLTTIPEYAFWDKKTYKSCETLVSITIPNGVTSIGQWAFAGCTNLTSITIPNNVTSIDRRGLFRNCTSLKSINVAANNPKFLSADGILYYKEKDENGYIAYIVPLGITGNVTIPSKINGEPFTIIGAYTFQYCKNLTGITIPNSVTTIGHSAFWGCTSLTNITIPDSVTTIGSQAFWECTSLTNITIPNSVTSIDSGAFGSCNSLTSVTFEGNIPGRKLIYDNRKLAPDAFGGRASYWSNGAGAILDVDDSYIGDLHAKYIAGGIGTYTTTAPVDKNSKWTKQSDSGNKSASAEKSSGSVSAFPGRWSLVQGPRDDNPEEMDLLKDGSGVVDEMGVKWKIENGRFYIISSLFGFSSNYNISGSTLTLTKDNGEVLKYKKK